MSPISTGAGHTDAGTHDQATTAIAEVEYKLETSGRGRAQSTFRLDVGGRLRTGSVGRVFSHDVSGGSRTQLDLSVDLGGGRTTRAGRLTFGALHLGVATNQYHSGSVTPGGGELKRSALDQSMGRAGFGFGVRNPAKDVSFGFVAYWGNDLVFGTDHGITNEVHLGASFETGQHRLSLSLDNTLVTPEGTGVLLPAPEGQTVPGQEPGVAYVDTRGAEIPSLSHGVTSATFGYEFSQDVGRTTVRVVH